MLKAPKIVLTRLGEARKLTRGGAIVGPEELDGSRIKPMG